MNRLYTEYYCLLCMYVCMPQFDNDVNENVDRSPVSPHSSNEGIFIDDSFAENISSGFVPEVT